MYDPNPNLLPEEALSDSFTNQNKKHLQELLSCFICYQRARGASMCPFCSKLYCESCIKRSLSHKQQCPNCRKSLKTSSMAYCSRFINELALLLEDLIQLKAIDEKCIEHNVEQNYYCRTCGLPICCQCQMFGEHKDHHIDHLDRIYQFKCQPVREGLLALKKEVKNKEACIKEVQGRNAQLAKQKQRRRAQIEQNNQVFKIKIFTQLSEEEKCLQEHHETVIQSLKKIEEVETGVVRKAGSDRSCGDSDAFLSGEMEKLCVQLPNRQPPQQKLTAIMSQLVPPYQDVHYTLENFSRRSKQKSIVYSPVVDLEGTQWRLKIHPNGSDVVHDTHFSVFLELVSSIRKDNIYEYKIEISNPVNARVRFFRQYGSNFEQNGSCWGYIKYMKLDDLIGDGYIENDCLNIKYSIRHPSYYHVSVFQQQYCSYLDAQIESQQDCINRLEQDIQFS